MIDRLFHLIRAIKLSPPLFFDQEIECALTIQGSNRFLYGYDKRQVELEEELKIVVSFLISNLRLRRGIESRAWLIVSERNPKEEDREYNITRVNQRFRACKIRFFTIVLRLSILFLPLLIELLETFIYAIPLRQNYFTQHFCTHFND